MSTLTLKLNAARTTSAWQLALDKYPFDVQRPGAPFLTRPDDRGLEQSIKPNRLREIKDRAHAATAEWKTVIARNLLFLDALEKQHGERFRLVTLVNSSRLLLHLGRASVLENVGLYCDRTTGLPVIPGSAVKGVVSTWACWEGNQARADFTSDRAALGKEITLILGTNPSGNNSGNQAAGNVIFMGGSPASPPVLDLDIVTPHPDEGKGRITPNPFLAIAPGCIWHFPLIASSRLSADECRDLLDRASAWLEEVLIGFGMGAKTAAGFGGFRLLTDQEKSTELSRRQERAKVWEKQENDKADEERIAALSPEDRAYEIFIASISDWTAAARDILKTEEPGRAYILRFFRTDAGKELIASWPKNDKAKQRKADLKEAGL